MKTERKLTKQELKRKEYYEKLCKQMEESGYEKHELTIGILYANIWATVVMLPFLILTAVLYVCFILCGVSSFHFTPTDFILSYGLFLIFIVLHEGIHGLVWAFYSKHKFSSIQFGVIWKYLTPYCTCTETLKKRHYITGALMPTVLLGFLPALYACATGSLLWLLTSEFMILGGGGDFLIILKMLRYKENSTNAVYFDHPYECGVVVFEKAEKP